MGLVVGKLGIQVAHIGGTLITALYWSPVGLVISLYLSKPITISPQQYPLLLFSSYPLNTVTLDRGREWILYGEN